MNTFSLSLEQFQFCRHIESLEFSTAKKVVLLYRLYDFHSGVFRPRCDCCYVSVDHFPNYFGCQ